MWPALIGAGLGLLKSEAVDKPNAERQRKLAATTAELSPWTGMTPTMPQEANPMGSMLQGGLAGAQIGQSLAGAAKPAALTQAASAAPVEAKVISKTPDAFGGKTDLSQDYMKGPDYFGADNQKKLAGQNTIWGSMGKYF